jgi:hypothetical protein
VDLLLEDIDLPASRVKLMTALEELIAAPNHGVTLVGWLVVVGIRFGEILRHALRSGAIEGAGHTGLAVGRGDFFVASGADGRVHVVGV